MVYTKQEWESDEAGFTPVSDVRMRHLETQYDEAVAYVIAALAGFSPEVDPADVETAVQTYLTANPITVPAATSSAAGILEIATTAETQDGTDGNRAVTPVSLAALIATAVRRGLVELATPAETLAGLDEERAVTPVGLAAALAALDIGEPGDPGDPGANGKGVVVVWHGGDANYPRPIGEDILYVEWRGSVQPNFWTGDDVWDATAAPEPGETIPTLGGTLVRHWRASDIAIADGATVTSWPARVGGVAFVTGGGTPQYKTSGGPNGKPYVKFEAASTEYLNAAIGTLAQPFTIIIVARWVVVGANERLITSQSITTPTRVYIGTSSGSNDSAYAGTARSAAAGTTDTAWHVFMGLFDNTAGNFRRDGSSSAGTIGAETLSGLRIGANGDASNPSDMEIAEILIYDQNLDASEYATVRTVLQERYATP